MNTNELQPWIIVLDSPDQQSLAMWRLSESDQPALALFTSEAQAEGYALANAGDAWSIQQPARPALLRIMIECFRQHIELAVLDPDQATARRIFKLRDVLRAAREELNSPP